MPLSADPKPASESKTEVVSYQNNEIIILNRSEWVRALPVLWYRVHKSSKIKYFQNIKVEKLVKDNNGIRINCISKECNKIVQYGADYVIFAIGRQPKLKFISNNVKKRFEYLKKINKLYAIGDLKNGMFRQTAICAGDGIKAAMEINMNIGRHLL